MTHDEGDLITSPVSRWNTFGELVATAIALAAATAAGAVVFAVASAGLWTFQELLLVVALPAAVVLAVALALAAAMRWRRLVHGILVGALAGLVGTVALEAVRITGFRVFGSMPGDLPMLMGVEATGRIMVGPNTLSTVVGYVDHFWNGAMFGVIYALLAGGFPQRARAWAGMLLGGMYGLVVGFGFVIGPVPTSIGVGGVFSTVSVAAFQTTVYLAHLGFGLVVGGLTHRLGRQIAPLWMYVWRWVRG